ncbi:hypothetical protein CRG98_007508 [Punica granatum]|uniref:Uncharacterized protein n=1 Tax=Punica granatum TaxID=22663 RepID=A0A2I0KUI2_PUNGR|nr:hypothetical protein CRG98_007508 [Punica granatum]
MRMRAQTIVHIRWVPLRGDALSKLMDVSCPDDSSSLDGRWQTFAMRRAGWAHSSIRGATVLVTLAAGRLSRALSIAAVACDHLQREGWASVLKCQGAGREGAGKRANLLGIVQARRGTSARCAEDACTGTEGCVRTMWWDALGCTKLVGVSFAMEGRSALGPRLALPWRKCEDRRWSTRKGFGSVHFPEGRMTDTHEKELPLHVYDSEVEGQ